MNLAELRWGRVVLPRAPRAGWDADAIAAALASDPFALDRGVRFEAVDAPVLRFEDERLFPDADLAARHDDPARITWLADRLREWTKSEAGQGAPLLGFLLGPWLGAAAPRAEELSEKVGVSVGEALVGVGSPAGLRFEAARDRLLASIGAAVRRDRVKSISPQGGRVSVSFEGAAAPLVVDAVVLAIGGLIGGGVMYVPPESLAGVDLPPRGGAPFRLSLDAPVALSMGGREALGVVSSMHGSELDVSAWPSGGEPGSLEAVGAMNVEAGASIALAGDVIAGRPRTLLEAVTSGLRAGRGV